MDQAVSAVGAAVHYTQLLITEQLALRTVRGKDSPREVAALLGMAQLLSSSPALLIDRLTTIAMDLTAAPSSGFSMLSLHEDGTPCFRRVSFSGQGSPPADDDNVHHYDSPYGLCLDSGLPQLFRDPGAEFAGAAGAGHALVETLVVPVADSKGTMLGALWIASHGLRPWFDAGDARVVGHVAAFAGAALESLRSRDEGAAQARATLLEDQRKDDFMLALAHELRNPLGALATAQRIMRQKDTAGAFASTLDAMQAQIKRMNILIEDLMELGKVRMGIIDLRCEDTAVVDMMVAAADAVAEQTAANGHVLTMRPGPPGLMAFADPARMTQVLVNLLTNAFKYTPAGGAVELRAEDHPGHIAFFVQDSGIGLKPGQLETIFSLYTQVDRSTPAAAHGLGIGLSLVRRLVELHGGTVTASSDGLGRGSCFTVHLPKPASAAQPPGENVQL